MTPAYLGLSTGTIVDERDCYLCVVIIFIAEFVLHHSHNILDEADTAHCVEALDGSFSGCVLPDVLDAQEEPLRERVEHPTRGRSHCREDLLLAGPVRVHRPQDLLPQRRRSGPLNHLPPGHFTREAQLAAVLGRGNQHADPGFGERAQGIHHQVLRRAENQRRRDGTHPRRIQHEKIGSLKRGRDRTLFPLLQSGM